MALVPPFIGSLVFTIVQFVVFLFVLVGTPLSQLEYGGACYTLFGLLRNCDTSHYTHRNGSSIYCTARRDTMNAGAAFAIISIFVTLVALIFGIFMIVKIKCAVFIPLVLVAVSLVTILIAWACPASMKTSSICGWKWDYMHYGAGFGLMVTAWVLELLNLVFLIILACF